MRFKTNAALSASPLMYKLTHEIVMVALQLDPDSLIALRITSKVLRGMIDGCVQLRDWVCATGECESFAYDRSLSHFTKVYCAARGRGREDSVEPVGGRRRGVRRL
jgi:hypothetical protein